MSSRIIRIFEIRIIYNRSYISGIKLLVFTKQAGMEQNAGKGGVLKADRSYVMHLPGIEENTVAGIETKRLALYVIIHDTAENIHEFDFLVPVIS